MDILELMVVICSLARPAMADIIDLIVDVLRMARLIMADTRELLGVTIGTARPRFADVMEAMLAQSRRRHGAADKLSPILSGGRAPPEHHGGTSF